MYRSLLVMAAFLVASSSLAADDTAYLKKVLSSKGFFGSGEGESWPYAGGFLVMKNNGGILTFHDLPPGVRKPKADDRAAMVFPAVDATKNFSFATILQGLAHIVGSPGIGLGHSSSVHFAQLSAQASRISDFEAKGLVNSQTMPQIRTWLDTGYRVFVIGIVLSTKNISVSSDSKTNLDLTFNEKPVSNCATDTKSQNTNDNSKPSLTNAGSASSASSTGASKSKSSSSPSTGSASASPGNAKTNSAKSNAASNAKNPSKASGSSSGGSGLHVCMASSSKLSMKNDVPLVFAAGAYEVDWKNPKLLPRLNPVMSVPKNSGPINEEVIEGDGPAAQEMTAPNVPLAESIDLHGITREPWPTSTKP